MDMPGMDGLHIPDAHKWLPAGAKGNIIPLA